MSKAMSFRLDDEVVAKLDYYAAVTGKSKTKFIEDAIERECFYMSQQRSGGINLNIPNPQFKHLDDAEKQVILNKLRKASEGIDLEIGLNLISEWLEDRFFNDTKELKNKLVDNFYQDLNFENNIKDDLSFIKE